jgi:glutathione reductase (NADPH)
VVGIDVHLETKLTSVVATAQGFVVSCERAGEKKQWTVDLVIHGAGRVPALDTLNLGAAGVDASKNGIAVNDFLQSVSNPAVYAAGDAADTSGLPLTPVAVFEGKVAASNMIKGNKTAPDYRGVPSVVFTIPELARVGLLEAEALEKSRDVRVRYTDTGAWFSNFRIGESCAAVKVLIDESTDEILGAHMLGPEYAELINFFALAVKLKLTAANLKKMTAAYPTVGSDLGALL